MSDKTSAKEASGSVGYIVSPLYDCVFFIYSPLIAMLLGISITLTPLDNTEVTVFGFEHYPARLFIGTFIAAHLFAVFFRSHGNSTVFKQFPYRFTLVPILLFLAMWSSLFISILVTVIAIWWDVYHSSMQTFGLGRIYDRCAGNTDANRGREMDKWLNILLYIGPILAGAALLSHTEYFNQFKRVHDEMTATPLNTETATFLQENLFNLKWTITDFLLAVPGGFSNAEIYLRVTIIAIGIPFLIYYINSYRKLASEGYKVSKQKVILYAGTGLCSIFAWGFNSFGQAFFIMNFFHALQYFALIWWSEKKSIQKLFLMSQFKLGAPVAFFCFLALSFGYGFWTYYQDINREDALWIVAMVVSIMHFWYDGFIWSVRKKQI
jgi:hypothetical protein